MKSKHILDTNLPLTQEVYLDLRKGLKLGDLKWDSFSKELKNAYHNFEEIERETDFEKRLHKGTASEYDYETPI
tara:strand:- start:4320 stop:4541 length:222 start_codon:yes stop_codon:yes gene_type:complete